MITIKRNEIYSRKIMGWGEIYEIMSVNYRLKKIWNKYKNCIVFLSSNKEHSRRGKTLKEMKKVVIKKNFKILEMGYVDCPPWKSKIKTVKKKKRINRFLYFPVKFIFSCLICLEQFRQNPKNAHMIYVVGRK